jgi:hypothetical protein
MLTRTYNSVDQWHLSIINDVATFSLNHSYQEIEWTPAKFRPSPYSAEDALIMTTQSEFLEIRVGSESCLKVD